MLTKHTAKEKLDKVRTKNVSFDKFSEYFGDEMPPTVPANSVGKFRLQTWLSSKFGKRYYANEVAKSMLDHFNSYLKTSSMRG